MNLDMEDPEEFARLMALPETHPDRVRAAASPRFAAMMRLAAEFESPAETALVDPGVKDAARELRRRLDTGLDRAEVRPAAPHARPPRGDSTTHRNAGLSFGRLALAFASVVIVAGGAWWAMNRGSGREAVMRGTSEPGAFRVEVASGAGDSVTLQWTAVPGAETYRIVFLGDDLGEIGSIDAGAANHWTLRAGGLPSGVRGGGEASIEITALRHGETLTTTPARTVRLP